MKTKSLLDMINKAMSIAIEDPNARVIVAVCDMPILVNAWAIMKTPRPVEVTGGYVHYDDRTRIVIMPNCASVRASVCTPDSVNSYGGLIATHAFCHGLQPSVERFIEDRIRTTKSHPQQPGLYTQYGMRGWKDY